jgi:protoporphyrinogen oxidase
MYERFWRPLFQHKFYEYADNISASWIWTRIRRIGRSRKSLLQEELGFMEGGSMTLVNALIEGIIAYGGRVHLGQAAKQITVQGGRVTGVQTPGQHYPADAVICTAPTPVVAALVPDLPEDWKRKYQAIHNIGVICVIFKLSCSVTPHFWVNVSEPDFDIPGFIEFSNLRGFGDQTIVYVPYYMPVSNAKFSWSDEDLLSDALACLHRVNPSVTAQGVIATKVARLRHGQPICEPGFQSKIPPVQTPIAGLQIADTCYYYPEDRGIAESIRLGCSMANSLISSAAPIPVTSP